MTACLDVIEAIVGPEIRFINSRCYLKPPGGLGSAWHRESEFFDAEDSTIVSAFIYLDDQTDANGAIRVVPGSHKSEHKHEPFDPKAEFGKKVDAKEFSGSHSSVDPAVAGTMGADDPSHRCPKLPQEVSLAMPKGSLLLLDHYTLHGSSPNRTKRKHRQVLTLGFGPPNVKDHMSGIPSSNICVRGAKENQEVRDYADIPPGTNP